MPGRSCTERRLCDSHVAMETEQEELAGSDVEGMIQVFACELKETHRANQTQLQ